MQSEVDTPNQTSFTAIHGDQTPAVFHIWIEIMDIKPSYSNTIHVVAVIWIRRKWQYSIDFQEKDGSDAGFSESSVA